MDRQIFLVMLLHTGVHLLLILGVNRLAGYDVRWPEALAAVILGGAYTGACMLPGFHFLGNGFLRLVSLGLTAWLAFHHLCAGAIFAVLSLAVSGLALDGGLWASLLSLPVVALLFYVGIPGGDAGRYVPVTLRHGQHCVHLTALRDTGNVLRDPVTGKSVLVVDGGICTEITGLSREQLRVPLQAISQLPGSRLIPYRTVGQPGGFLLALPLSDVTVGRWKGKCLVAFAPDGLDNREFQGLTGGIR